MRHSQRKKGEVKNKDSEVDGGGGWEGIHSISSTCYSIKYVIVMGLELADPCQHENSIKLVGKLFFLDFFFPSHRLYTTFNIPSITLNSQTHLRRLPSTHSSEWSVLWLYMRSLFCDAARRSPFPSTKRAKLFPLSPSSSNFYLIIFMAKWEFLWTSWEKTEGRRVEFDSMFIALWCLYSTLFMMVLKEKIEGPNVGGLLMLIEMEERYFLLNFQLQLHCTRVSNSKDIWNVANRQRQRNDEKLRLWLPLF